MPEKFDINKIRNDFPILSRQVHGKPLVYLDNAASTQKPQAVIDTITQFYTNEYSNIHRGVHYLSGLATGKYEKARETVRKFINAGKTSEIVFTRGGTEAINLVAATYGRKNLKPGDEVLISEMEHHSNIVPWQIICQETGAELKVIPMDDDCNLLYDKYLEMVSEKTKFISVVHISNSLGTVNPIKDIIDHAHSYDIPVLIDAAQSVQHTSIDVQALDCDFLAFSGHKIYGPTGIGVLYGKEKLLDEMPPYQGGGDMISSVKFECTTYNELPYKFEAGTPNIVGPIGLAKAIEYVESVGMDNIVAQENDLLDYATKAVEKIDTLEIVGRARKKSSVLSFTLRDVHPHDIGTFLDADGVAIRTGHHCTEPVMRHFKIPATSRASFSFYNTKEEIDILVESIKNVIEMFS